MRGSERVPPVKLVGITFAGARKKKKGINFCAVVIRQSVYVGIGLHVGAVVRAATSQQEGPGFEWPSQTFCIMQNSLYQCFLTATCDSMQSINSTDMRKDLQYLFISLS